MSRVPPPERAPGDADASSAGQNRVDPSRADSRRTDLCEAGSGSAPLTKRRPHRFWARTGAALLPHLVRTTPWVPLVAGCASGTLVLVVFALFADTDPLGQSTVRITLLPAVAGLVFVPHAQLRPLTDTTPVPVWVSIAGQTLLALPLLALTCWIQLALTAGTFPSGVAAPRAPAVYPLVAQFAGWSLLAAAVTGCCERTRYRALSGVVGIAASAAFIAAASYVPWLQRQLLSPPAAPRAATLAWYSIAFAALVLAGTAGRDAWHRYMRRVRIQRVFR